MKIACAILYCHLCGLFGHTSFSTLSHKRKSRDSSVGIATRYGLEGSGDRIPVGARFSAPIQTGSEAHPASCTSGTGSFPG